MKQRRSLKTKILVKSYVYEHAAFLLFNFRTYVLTRGKEHFFEKKADKKWKKSKK